MTIPGCLAAVLRRREGSKKSEESGTLSDSLRNMCAG